MYPQMQNQDVFSHEMYLYYTERDRFKCDGVAVTNKVTGCKTQAPDSLIYIMRPDFQKSPLNRDAPTMLHPHIQAK